jgi:hypothetical protein
MAVIPLTISGLKEAQADLERLNKEFDKVKNDPIKSKKIAKEFNDLSKSVDEATAELVKMNEAGKLVGTRFDDLNEVLYGTKEEILPLTSQIGEMEDRMYQLAAAGQTNTAEFKTLQAETSRLRKVIIDTDKSVDLLAENQGLAVFGTGLTQVGERLLRLDFQGAAQDATAMNRAVGNLGKAGTQAISGLTKTVGQLGKTFAMIGKALLTNPIFLIGAAIAALVTIIVTLMNKLGLLQPILDTIGEIFAAIKWAIDQVVQALKDFTDWLGITDNATKDFLNNQIDLAKQVVDKSKEVEGSIEDRYNKEIRLAQIAGEDTTRLEIEKQEKYLETAEKRKLAIESQIKALEALGKADEKELQDLRDSLKETERVIIQGNNEIEILQAQRTADEDKRREEQLSKDKASYEKRIAEQKQFEKDRLMIARQIKDLELELLNDGITKELEQNKIKYDRLIEDLDTNESLLAEERLRLKQLYLEQQFEAEKQIELDYQKALDEALAQANEERKAKKEEERQNELDRQKAFNNALLMANEESQKKELAQAEAYAQAKENLQETLVGSLKGLSDSLTQAGIENAGLQKTLALVDIAVNTAKSLSNIIAGATAAAAASGPAAPFVLGGYIASGVATVAGAVASAYAALKEAPAIGGSSGGSTPATASASSFQAAQPNVNLFGQNDFNNLSESQDVETGSQEITVKAVVSETEVTSTQNKIKKLTESASL